MSDAVKGQVLLCPVCGRSGALSLFNIDPRGNPTQERSAHQPKIGIRKQRSTNGQMYWTHHALPLQVKVALRQQLVEALTCLDVEIAEEME